MIHSGRFTALLDANVLYPAPLRDYLLRLAEEGLYKPKWTEQIQNEWIENLLHNRIDLSKSALDRTKNAMNKAFPDANIDNYEKLNESINLPDPGDRHVLAAAIRGKADVIVTSNLKDFPISETSKFDIEVQSPDEFISNLIHLDEDKCLKALDVLVGSLKNPTKSKEEVLDTLANCGISGSVSLLRTAPNNE